MALFYYFFSRGDFVHAIKSEFPQVSVMDVAKPENIKWQWMVKDINVCQLLDLFYPTEKQSKNSFIKWYI